MGAGVIVIALVLKAFVFDVAEVGHNGMAPTLVRGERVLIYKRGEPKLGSIAVCQHPTEVGHVVGRVAATGGMTIGSFRDELKIDGEPVVFDQKGTTSFYNADNDLTDTVIWGDEHFRTEPHQIFMAEKRSRHLIRKTDITEGKVFLLGDHRAYMGQDSRAYGLVDAATCRGTIVFRLTPAGDLDPAIAHGYLERVR